MTQGFGSAKELKALLENTFSNLKSKIMRLNKIYAHWKQKIAIYDESIKLGVDLFNMQRGL